MQGEFDFGDVPARVRVAKPGVRPVRGRPASSISQLWLPGCAPTRLDGFFFALRPDEQAADEIHETARSTKLESGLHGRLIGKECLHVSMQGIGAYEGVPNDICRKAAEAAQSVDMQGFELCSTVSCGFVATGGERLSCSQAATLKRCSSSTACLGSQ